MVCVRGAVVACSVGNKAVDVAWESGWVDGVEETMGCACRERDLGGLRLGSGVAGVRGGRTAMSAVRRIEGGIKTPLVEIAARRGLRDVLWA